MPNVVISSEIGGGGGYFGTYPADRVHVYLCFEPSACIRTKGFQRLSNILKKSSEIYSLNSVRLRAL